jgi:hypothetical protein
MRVVAVVRETAASEYGRPPSLASLALETVWIILRRLPDRGQVGPAPAQSHNPLRSSFVRTLATEVVVHEARPAGTVIEAYAEEPASNDPAWSEK